MGLSVKKIQYVTIFYEFLNPERHPNCITGSKVTAIFLNGWVLPISGASAVKGLRLQPAQQACFLYKASVRFCELFLRIIDSKKI